MEKNSPIADSLLKIEAVKLSTNPPFTWVSGIKSPIYCDNRLLISYPEHRDKVIAGFIRVIEEQGLKPDVIAGTATSGIPFAAWIADRLSLPMIYVRAEKKARAEELRKQPVNGSDFAKTAAENSDCPSKNKGGSLGSFQRGRMAKAFEEAAFTQKVNEIGPVVETQYGYHIIKVQDHTPPNQKTFEEVKDQIRNHLVQKNKNMAVREYIESLKSKATIVYAEQ